MFISKKLLLNYVIVVGIVLPLNANQDGYKKARILDRLYVQFTNSIAPKEVKDKFLADEISLVEVAQSLKNDARLKRQLAYYWSEIFKITAKVDWDDTTNHITEENLSTVLTQGRLRPIAINKGLVFMNGVYALNAGVNLTTAKTPAGNAARDYWQKNDCMRTPFNYRKVAANVAVTNQFSGTRWMTAAGVWIRGKQVEVNPWWDKAQTVKVCEGVVARCGENLEQCFPTDNSMINKPGTNARDPKNFYVRNIDEGFSLEPGMMIAGIITGASEGLSWDDVVTGNFTMMNGTTQHFLNIPRWGGIIVGSSPEGAWKNEEDIVSLPNANPKDKKWYPIFHKDTKRHAGVLTTLAFQKTYNGHYAKANGAMEALLCKKFSAPDGAVIPPSKETEPVNMPFCSSCHQILDPLSHHFRRWPEIGDSNFYYNPTAGLSAVGNYEGHQDADTYGLGRTFTKTDDFYQCGISRTFEFVVGRPMLESEKVSFLPSLMKTLRENNNEMWPVIEQIISSPAFTGENHEAK